MKDHFKILFIIGRPAAGKSEIIDYLKKTPLDKRLERFHIGDFAEIDDFPFLWSWFEEDSLVEKMGKDRLHTDKEGYFKEQWMWDLLIRRLEFEYGKKLREEPDLDEKKTIIMEFARGGEHGGFRSAFSHFSEELLEKSAVLYIDVSFSESLRKNRKRFNPDRPHSILEHSLPDEKMEKLYGESDWEEFSSADPEYLHLHSIKLPYVVFENEDDVTTEGGERLGGRLEDVLGRLWKIKAGDR